MKLPAPAHTFQRMQEVARNRQIEQADRDNHKRGQDVEIGTARLILTSPDGTRYSLDVANDGTLSTNAV